MKQCPNCQTVYTDDSLQFCLSDGATLVSTTGDAPTVRMSYGNRNEPVRVNIPNDSVPTIFAAPPIIHNQTVPANQPPKSNGLGLIFAGLFGILLLLFGGAAAAYFLLPGLIGQQNSSVNSAAPSPNVAPKTSPTSAADDETERLKKEMANLKKQLEDQQKNQRGANSNVAPSGSPARNWRTGYANSPNDGFLALRSEPSSEAGERLARIPHNAPLTVFDCPRPSNVGKMPGRWCRVLYEGQTGWAFDGFIRY